MDHDTRLLPIRLTSVQKVAGYLDALTPATLSQLLAGAGLDPAIRQLAGLAAPKLIEQARESLPDDPKVLDAMLNQLIGFATGLCSDPEPEADHTA